LNKGNITHIYRGNKECSDNRSVIRVLVTK